MSFWIPFSGSGTSGLVSLKLNRKYIGIELNPEYVRMSAHRIKSNGRFNLDEVDQKEGGFFAKDRK